MKSSYGLRCEGNEMVMVVHKFGGSNGTHRSGKRDKDRSSNEGDRMEDGREMVRGCGGGCV